MFENPRPRENAGIRQVVLLVTQSCNLNCKYCYETFKSRCHMSVSTGKKLLMRSFSEAVEDGTVNELAISYLGGEPLVNFDFIVEISEWLWSRKWPLKYSLDLTTNGTLLTQERRLWLEQNKSRIEVMLSLDGLNEAQSINRTAQDVDVDFFVRNWPQNRINMVLYPDSIRYFAKSVKELLDRGIRCSVAMGAGFRWKSEAVREYEKQLAELIPCFVDNPVEARRSGIFLNIEHCLKPVPLKVRLCSAETSHIICYDSDGERYGCHMMTPLVLGREKAARLAQAQQKMDDIRVDERCRSCPIFHECRICPAMSIKVNNDVEKHYARDTYCNMMKVQARQSAILICRYIDSLVKNNVYLDGIERQLLQKALTILNHIPSADMLHF